MKPTALGTNVYAGGFTVGIKRHFTVQAVLEEAGYGSLTHRANHPEVPVHVGPLDDWAPATPGDDPDLIFGNPPCAAWSTAGHGVGRGRDKWRSDPRVDCTTRHFNLLVKWRPKLWVTESVTNAWTIGREFIDGLAFQALDLGYSVTYLLHDSRWLGVPQKRKRFFMIAHRIDINLPAPNWAPPQSAREALLEIGDTGEPYVGRGQFLPILSQVAPGGKLRDTWDQLNPTPTLRPDGKVNGRPPVMIGRLGLDGPAPTYVGHAVIHPTTDRFLSADECAHLCGFPSEYKFIPRNFGVYSLIARGVCPPVADWLGRNLALAIERGVAVTEPTVTLIDHREPPGSVQRLPPPPPPGSRRADQGVGSPAGDRSTPVAPPPAGFSTSTRSAVPDSYLDEYLRLPAADPLAEYGPEWPPLPGSPSVPGRTPVSPPDPLAEYGPLSVPRASSVAPTPPRLVRAPRKLNLGGGTGSGALIRERLRAGVDAETILAEVHSTFPGRKTAIGDVRWNYYQLVKAGVALPPLTLTNHQRHLEIAKATWASPAGGGGATAGALPGNGTAAGGPTVTAPAAERTVASWGLNESPPGVMISMPPGTVEGDWRNDHLRVKKPTALLTGMTPIQVGSQKTALKIITAMSAWKNILDDLGYRVDWRPVVPGEELKDYDVVLVGLNKPNAIAATHAHGAVWALYTRPDAIGVVDDWQTSAIVPGFRTYSKSEDRAFRLRGEELDADVKNMLMFYYDRLSQGAWDFPVIAPVFRGGDVGKLRLPAKRVIGLDPSPYVHRYRAPATAVKERRWVRASLLDKGEAPVLSWPVLSFGNPDKPPGGVGFNGPNAQPRVPESELMAHYATSWGVLSPPHPHAGSGWWRVRFLMAADAGCVISCAATEATAISTAHVKAWNSIVVEGLSDDGLKTLAMEQAVALAEIHPTREELKDRFTDLLKERVPA